MAKSIFAFYLRTRFLQTCGFNRIIKAIMMYDLNPENLQTNGLFFFEKSKKPYFWGVSGHYCQNEIFSQKSGSISFLPLRHPNAMRSFRKILWAVLEKTCSPTDTLTYWQWWNHRTPFCLTAGGPKNGGSSKWCLLVGIHISIYWGHSY